MEKPRIALFWCSSCGGCEESVIDLAEDLLLITERADIVFWPVAMDFKYEDLKVMDDGYITASFINGAVRMDEQEDLAKLLRRKSKLLIAHGSCAHLGGVVGLANFFQHDDILRRSYKEVPSVKNEISIFPKVRSSENGNDLELSGFHDTVKALDQVVDVDFYIPGCPPTPELVKEALMMIIEESLPSVGTVLGEKKALCDTCPRKKSFPVDLQVDKFKRLYETEWNTSDCFLEQRIICLGPATRGGCSARCIEANMPCKGCFGPTENVKDQGAKSISLLSAIIDLKEEDRLGAIVESIPDPAGLFYRYSLPSSMLKRKITKNNR